MRKYLKRKNKAVAVIAIALMICTLCALPASASNELDWIEVETDNEGFYPTLRSFGNRELKLVFVSSRWGLHSSLPTIQYKLAGGNLFELSSVKTKEKLYQIEFVGNVDDILHQFNDALDIPTYSSFNFLDDIDDVNIKPRNDDEQKILLYVRPLKRESNANLITEMFSSFRGAIDGLTNGIKGMFNAILWNDGTATSGLSYFAKFGFVMAGLSLALGLGYVIINKIRG